ncbi:MAG: hypothetical protein ABIB61_04935 [Candidatus Shapirobacteria bacterium]
MSDNKLNFRFYEDFGLAGLARRLGGENKQEELKTLENTLSSYILLQALKELSPEDQEKLEALGLKNGRDLYGFFNKHIINFDQRIKEYGRTYQSTIAGSQ